MRPQVETNSGLSAVLRGVVADLQHASGADIVSIFLYEEATHTYYAGRRGVIKLSGERRAASRSPSYKFDFGKGEAIDGTQATVRAAVRRIREPGVPDNAHLNMLRHVIEKRHPAVGILSIREAIGANQRVRDLEAMAVALLARGEWTSYAVGTRPAFEAGAQQPAQQAIGTTS